jgi:malate dehydrogenase
MLQELQLLFVDSILNDQKKMIACSVLLKENMVKMILYGVCIIGKNGVEEIEY